MLDVLIIGAGLAGQMAALTAARAGLKVRIIAKGLGALHWTAGTIDVLGYVGGGPLAVENPFAAMVHLPAEHPYRLLGAERVAAALRDFQTLADEEGLPYASSEGFDQNTLLPSPAGAVRPVFLAPLAQMAGKIEDTRPMLIVGVEGLRDVYPHLMVENLSKQGITARAAFVRWEAVSDQRDRNPVQLAAGLDEPVQLRRLASALKPLVRSGERVGLPAILGLDAHTRVRADLEAEIGATVFEFPTLPPSVPGIRLYQTLRRALLRAGVRTETNMEVIGFHADGNEVQWVESATAARPLRHRARAYLLATGGVLGGGIVGSHTGEVRETVFELPLTVENNRGAWFRPHFLDPDGQPIFRGGVRVGDDFRAQRADGARAFTNLWAAGGALANADPILERSLEGLAITTGVAAGQALVAALGAPHRQKPESAAA